MPPGSLIHGINHLYLPPLTERYCVMPLSLLVNFTTPLPARPASRRNLAYASTKGLIDAIRMTH